MSINALRNASTSALSTGKHRVVVVGAGSGGLAVANQLWNVAVVDVSTRVSARMRRRGEAMSEETSEREKAVRNREERRVEEGIRRSDPIAFEPNRIDARFLRTSTPSTPSLYPNTILHRVVKPSRRTHPESVVRRGDEGNRWRERGRRYEREGSINEQTSGSRASKTSTRNSVDVRSSRAEGKALFLFKSRRRMTRNKR